MTPSTVLFPFKNKKLWEYGSIYLFVGDFRTSLITDCLGSDELLDWLFRHKEREGRGCSLFSARAGVCCSRNPCD